MSENLNEQFSRELKGIRESKGISLEQIAAKTRIDIKFLIAIEEGKFSIIDEVYVRAFIREYAQYLDLDGNEILARYDETKKSGVAEGKIIDVDKKDYSNLVNKTEFDSNLKSTTEATLDEVSSEFSLSSSQKKMILYASIGLFVIIVIILFTVVFSSSSEIITEPDYDELVGQQEARYESDNRSATRSARIGQDSLVLKIVARDTSWILINRDDVVSEDYTFYPGRVKEVKAQEKFNLTIGNSRGITLLLNGDTLRFAGNKGQVRYLLVDESGLRIVTNRASGTDE